MACARNLENGAAFFDAAADGTLVYQPAAPPEERSLVWIDRQGKAETIPTLRRAFQSPSLSPDGRRIAVEVAEGPRSDVWVFEFATGSFSRLTSTGLDGMPLWSLDGQRLAYAARRDEERHIMWQPLDGSAAPESLVRSRNRIWPSAWTSGGKGLVFVEDPPTSLPDIKLLNMDDRCSVAAGGRATARDAAEPVAGWPLDRLHHVREGPACHGASLQRRRGAGDHARPGRGPAVAGDGREIVSRNFTNFRLLRIQTTPEFSISTARGALSAEDRGTVSGQPHGYDVAPDGSRFLFIDSEPSKVAPPGVAVVEHFFSELRRRAPVQR